MRTVDLLALDDFGAQSDTAWAREKLFQPVNYWVNSDLPMVVTSNWTERKFAQYHGRIASRPKAAVHVHIGAPDARGRGMRRIAMTGARLALSIERRTSNFGGTGLTIRRSCLFSSPLLAEQSV